MKIWLNETARPLENHTDVATLLTGLGLPVHAVAVAVNNDIIARSAWAETVLEDGDRVAIFQAIAGG